jgi:hypothetical protein
MRLRFLALASILPVALAAVPGTAQAQRTNIRCRERSACIADNDVARLARERALRIRDDAQSRARDRHLAAADRARETAFRARMRAEEQRERARELRETRRFDRPRAHRVRW